jgi:uncharacterized protein
MTESTFHAHHETLASPTPSGERNPVIDILRGFAVFGILLVNFPGAEAARVGVIDDTVKKLLSLFVSGKFYTTFSFLFGLGFALQLLRAEAVGRRIVPVYIRRMIALFLIGFAHAVLIWPGDVLLVYAIMGLFLIPLRKLSARVLLPLAAVVLAGEYFMMTVERPILFSDVIPRVADPELEQQAELQQALVFNEGRDAGRRLQVAIRTGTWPEAVAARFEVWRFSSRFVFRYLWISSFAMFLIGLCAGRYRVLRSPPVRSALIRRVMWTALPIWLILGLLTTYGQSLLGPLYFKIHWKLLGLAWVLHAPAGSLFYITAIVSLLALWPKWISRLAPLAAVGRMPLTNYLLQSIAGTFLYYGYGLNLRIKLGFFSGFALTVALFAVQIVLSRWWMARFQFGPAEWLWRTMTYWHLQPIRRQAPATVAAPLPT